MLVSEFSPIGTNREILYNIFKDCENPTIYLTKKLDITRVRRYSRRHNIKLNMLLCWIICKAASDIKEFYVIYNNHMLHEYDNFCVNLSILTKDGRTLNCDIPFSNSIEEFSRNYDSYIAECMALGKLMLNDNEYATIGASAIVTTELEAFSAGYTKMYPNPYLSWGKYHKGWFKTTLNFTLRVNHIQMDGTHCSRFFNNMEKIMKEFPRILKE